MYSSTISIDDEQDQSYFSNAHELEILYQETIRAGEKIIEEEKIRRLKLRILMEENQKNDLHDHLSSREEYVIGLKHECKELREQLAQAEEKASQLETHLKNQASEMKELRVGLRSLKNPHADSANNSTDNLCFSTELLALKSEIDELRSKSSNWKDILEEKVTLEEQVSVLKKQSKNEDHLSKQLEALNKDLIQEKRNHEIACKDMESKYLDNMERLQKELDQQKKEKSVLLSDLEAKINLQEYELQKSLAKINEEKHHQALSELKSSENRISDLENQLCKMQEKIESSETRLQNCQDELNIVQASSQTNLETHNAESRPKSILKRNSQEISTDAATTTTTSDRGATRRARNGVRGSTFEHSSVGEKSMFSVTPYLNRTINMESDPPPEIEVDELKENDAVLPVQPSSKDEMATVNPDLKLDSTAIPKKPRGRKKAAIKILDSTGSVQPSSPSAKSKKKGSAGRKIACSPSSQKNEAEGNDEQTKDCSESTSTYTNGLSSNVADLKLANRTDVTNTRTTKNRRKLLRVVENNFDHEGQEDGEDSMEPAVKPHRKLGKEVYPKLISNSDGNPTVFSPLKRNRSGKNSKIQA